MEAPDFIPEQNELREKKSIYSQQWFKEWI